MITAFREWLIGSPIMQELNAYAGDTAEGDNGAAISIETVGEKSKSYGISTAGEIVIKKYICGEHETETSYSLLARESFASDKDRSDNYVFLNRAKDWINAQNKSDNLFHVENKIINSVTAENIILTNGDTENGSAIYALNITINHTGE